MPDDEPRRRAHALHYEPGESAPTVTATGSGLVAERIIAVAREAGVPIRFDPGLAEALAQLDLGARVPESLWKAVAQVLAWAYRLDAEAARRHGA
jgi:flagellar biosynthesis protein